MDMAPLALSAQVDSLTLADHESLSSAFLPPSASSAANTTGTSKATTASVGFDGTQSFQAALGLKVETAKGAKTTKTKTASPEKKVFRCAFPGCGREFQLKGNLKRHANIHNGDKKFACKFCGKRFLRKADMEVHYRVHTGEKPYRCKYQECGKCFARRSDLLSHERTHTGRKPFACAFPGCDRSFARKFDLHKHQRLHEDQADGSGKAKCKKRKLSPRQADASTPASKRVDSGDESCDCPSDVSTPFVGGATSTAATLSADVLLPASVASASPPCPVGRRKISATAACLDTPTRPMRYELKCPENHIHSPPACLAALSSWDAFLLSQESLDLARPFSLEAFPPHCPSSTIGTSCCPAHLELRPPPPDASAASAKASNGPSILDQLLFAPMAINPVASKLDSSMAADSGLQHSALPGSAPVSHAFPAASLAFIGQDPNTAMPSVQGTPSASPAMLSAANGSAAQAKPSAAKACLSTPTPVESLLDYSRHNRSCGHLSIQHGNHRDYVVQNHLVCQDNITRLGSLKTRAPGNVPAEVEAVAAKPVKCTSPKDTHRPGCGHLPVRHKDHIDYVVEDSLICQQASWLEEDNLELLGDDFWDFYGAVDAFPTK